MPIELEAGEKRVETVRLWRGASLAGVVLNEFNEPLPGVRVQAWRKWKGLSASSSHRGFSSEPTDARGRYRISGLPPDEYIVVVQGDQAVALTLALGEERSGIDFHLRAVRPAHVTGRVIRAADEHIRNAASVSHRRPGVRSDEFADASATLNPDGTFALRDVPGPYVLEVRRVHPSVDQKIDLRDSPSVGRPLFAAR
jgi:hypothetical protein